MISKRRDCRLMKCTTVLHGGVRHCTSTPRTSGKQMKRKRKILVGKRKLLRVADW